MISGPIDCAQSLMKNLYDQLRQEFSINAHAVTLLVPLADVTGGDEDRDGVWCRLFEGPVTVRAGDFLLAKGGESANSCPRAGK